MDEHLHRRKEHPVLPCLPYRVSSEHLCRSFPRFSEPLFLDDGTAVNIRGREASFQLSGKIGLWLKSSPRYHRWPTSDVIQ